MKNLVSLLTVTLTALVSSSFAEPGHTYTQDCQEFGGPGTVDRPHHAMVWRIDARLLVSEIFVKNSCVSMRLVPDEGFAYGVNAAEQVLRDHMGSYKWIRFAFPDSKYVALWHTDDDELLAAIYANGCMQISYKWWLASRGLLEEDHSDYGNAPVEDSPGANM